MPLQLRLILLQDRFAVCRLGSDEPIPDWLANQGLVSITRSPDELSLVCSETTVPEGIRCERSWRCLRVAGTLDFSLVGVIASLACPLAEAGISIFVISTFDTDYLLVKEQDLDRAIQALTTKGHRVVR